MQGYKVADMIVWPFWGKGDVIVYPVFDVHLGAQGCMEEDFRNFINEVAVDPQAYVVIGGDMIDNGTRNSVTNVFRATMRPSEQKREMANILAPIRDKILCFTSGNHERRFNKDADDNPLYDIAAKLDLEHLYREDLAWLHMQLGTNKSIGGGRSAGKDRQSYSVIVSHGAGGGMLTGGAVNRVERLPHDADVLITGHTHNPFATFPARLTGNLINNNVYALTQLNIKATSWLKYGDYAAEKLLRPSAHVMQRIVFSSTEKRVTVVSEI